MNFNKNLPISSFLLFIFLLGVTSCSKDDLSTPQHSSISTSNGVYLLNQGTFGNSDASLDYYDFSKDSMSYNLFSTINPEVPLGLGDVGNDLGIYGSKMYIVVNNSNKIEVVDAHTVKRIKKIDLNQPRYVVFHQGKAYATSYDNYVYVIDTASLTIEDSIAVGSSPEQMAVVGKKLYVANSGGMNFPNYDSTLSVINLTADTVIEKITVGINPTGIVANKEEKLYVITSGNYENVPANLYSVDTQEDKVDKTFDIGATNMALFQNKLYVYQNAYNANTQQYQLSYTLINTQTNEVAAQHFLNSSTEDQIETPFGLTVRPDNGDILITSAKNFSSPGTLYYLDAEGQLLGTATTGVNPSGFAFLH